MSSTSSLAGRKLVLSTLLETEHYESLIKDLTCNKCNRYMKPPIHLCVDGHSICGPCYEKSFQCHICQKEFALMRPAVLESLANKVLFRAQTRDAPSMRRCPCSKNIRRIASLGSSIASWLEFMVILRTPCTSLNKTFTFETDSIVDIDIFYKHFKTECKWEGRAGEWMDHCFVNHKERVSDLPFITVKDRWDAKKTEPVLNYFLLRCYDKVFNVYQIYDKRGGRMMWTVLVNDDQAERYYFEIDLFLPNFPSKRIVYRRPCKCEKDADFLEHTQNVYIPVENVFSMLDSDESMNFIVRIGEVENLPLLDTPTISESLILLAKEEQTE